MVLTIDEKGNVTDVRIVSSNPPRVFDRVVRDTLIDWKCVAEGSNYQASVEINFTLKDEGAQRRDLPPNRAEARFGGASPCRDADGRRYERDRRQRERLGGEQLERLARDFVRRPGERDREERRRDQPERDHHRLAPCGQGIGHGQHAHDARAESAVGIVITGMIGGLAREELIEPIAGMSDDDECTWLFG